MEKLSVETLGKMTLSQIVELYNSSPSMGEFCSLLESNSKKGVGNFTSGLRAMGFDVKRYHAVLVISDDEFISAYKECRGDMDEIRRVLGYKPGGSPAKRAEALRKKGHVLRRYPQRRLKLEAANGKTNGDKSSGESTGDFSEVEAMLTRILANLASKKGK